MEGLENETGHKKIKVGKLNLVDLAGSERVRFFKNKNNKEKFNFFFF